MGSLSQLKDLFIYDCDKLEQITEDEESLLQGFKRTINSSAPLPHLSQNLGLQYLFFV